MNTGADNRSSPDNRCIAALGLALAAVVGSSFAPARSETIEPARTVDEFFAQYARPDSPGIAVGIYHQGRPILLRGYGSASLEHRVPITPATRFMAGSLAKQFTAFSVALLMGEGKVSLDRDVRSVLPYVPDFGHRITVEHLLRHASGLRDQWSLYELATHSLEGPVQRQPILNLIARQRALNFEPGSEYLYCNTGYTLLAEIVGTLSGKDLQQFAQARIFGPLAMEGTAFRADVTEVVPNSADSYRRDGNTWRRAIYNRDVPGASSLWTTAADMMKWAANFSRPIVGDADLVRGLAAPGALHDGTALNYGFGLMRASFAGHEAMSHAGGGAAFAAWFAYFPKEDFAVALLANTPIDLRERMESIVELYLGRAQPPRSSPDEIVPDASVRAALPGHYVSAYGRMITLSEDDGRLRWQTSNDSPRPLVVRSDGSFDSGAASGRRFRPQFDAAGRVLAILELGPTEAQSLHRRIERAEPTPEELAELAGEYYSRELQTVYSLAVESGRLVARSPFLAAPIVFLPVTRDRFDTDSSVMETVVFVRNGTGNGSGRTMGFEVHASRIRHVAFARTRLGRE